MFSSSDLDATVYTTSGVAELIAAAERASRGTDRPVPVHLKVDTGMHRVGAQPHEALELAQVIAEAPTLHLRSVFTHCAVADEHGNPFTDVQLRRYRAVLDEMAAAGIEVGLRHAANTAATIDHPAARLDLVRCGIGIYGLAPAPELAGAVDLVPALSLTAEVSHQKRVGPGEGISYGLAYRPERETTIATVPIGYADGVPRALGDTEAAAVLVGGRRRPIAGTITMDQLMVDCGDDPVDVGDPVVLIGRQGEEQITVDDWAKALRTITYEIVCGISPRVPRRYQQGSHP